MEFTTKACILLPSIKLKRMRRMRMEKKMLKSMRKMIIRLLGNCR